MKKTLIALVGTKFRGAEMVALLASLPQGEPLTLIREPANKFDANAVQVWAQNQHIGYLKSNQNKSIAAAMDRAIEQQKLSRGGGGVWTGRLAVDGGKQPMVEIDE